MRRWLPVILVIVLLAGLVGCGNENAEPEQGFPENKIIGYIGKNYQSFMKDVLDIIDTAGFDDRNYIDLEAIRNYLEIPFEVSLMIYDDNQLGGVLFTATYEGTDEAIPDLERIMDYCDQYHGTPSTYPSLAARLIPFLKQRKTVDMTQRKDEGYFESWILVDGFGGQPERVIEMQVNYNTWKDEGRPPATITVRYMLAYNPDYNNETYLTIY